MLIDVTTVHVMKMPIMQVVHVIAVADCGMAARGAMLVHVLVC